MDDNEVDRYRIRELAAWDRDYTPYPWEVLPIDAKESWRNRYNESGDK